MPKEIERKFLVSTPPENLENFNSNEIIQGYIFISDDLEIRLRQKGNLYFQTIKSSGDLERSEYEIELTKNQFEKLWPLTSGKRVLKTRYEIDYQNHLIELDIYSESLQGLITAEVEFRSTEESNEFNPPSWFGDDLTKDKNYLPEI